MSTFIAHWSNVSWAAAVAVELSAAAVAVVFGVGVSVNVDVEVGVTVSSGRGAGVLVAGGVLCSRKGGREYQHRKQKTAQPGTSFSGKK